MKYIWYIATKKQTLDWDVFTVHLKSAMVTKHICPLNNFKPRKTEVNSRAEHFMNFDKSSLEAGLLCWVQQVMTNSTECFLSLSLFSVCRLEWQYVRISVLGRLQKAQHATAISYVDAAVDWRQTNKQEFKAESQNEKWVH